MNLAVKYCGGCNPHFDRKDVVERLLREFPEIRLVGLENPPGGEPDLLVVVGGCSSFCASHEHLSAKRGKVMVASASDYEKLRDRVANELAGERNRLNETTSGNL